MQHELVYSQTKCFMNQWLSSRVFDTLNFSKRYSNFQQIGAMSIPEKEVLLEEIPHHLHIMENKPFFHALSQVFRGISSKSLLYSAMIFGERVVDRTSIGGFPHVYLHPLPG